MQYKIEEQCIFDEAHFSYIADFVLRWVCRSTQ